MPDTAWADSKVRNQYENLPYPLRFPEDEKKRLICLPIDYLSGINARCYRGRRDFHDHFRVLIAGGGTGDSVIYLAHQLRQTNAEIVYVDISKTSMDIARKRARARGLHNIRWKHGSLLDVGEMDIGKFDYINSVGVLHHLPTPPAGLRALESVLAEGGAMGIMVYAQIGRTGIYQLQELLRKINEGVDDIQQKIDNARQLLKHLPPGNWFQHTQDIVQDTKNNGDAGIYDLLLHSRDRAYTVDEVYDFVENAGLKLASFISNDGIHVTPQFVFSDPEMLAKVEAMPIRRQQAICELAYGKILKHQFYLSRDEDPAARLDDLENVPFYNSKCDMSGEVYQALVEAHEQQQPTVDITLDRVELRGKYNITIPIAKASNEFFRLINGQRTMGEILDEIRAAALGETSNEELLEDIRPVYETLKLFDAIILRHKSARQWPLGV